MVFLEFVIKKVSPIYHLTAKKIKEHYYDRLGRNGNDENIEGYLKEMSEHLKDLICGIHLIKPIITNDRLRVQQGCFSVYGGKLSKYWDSDDYSEYIHIADMADCDLENSDEILATFIIPANKKKEIREELERLGIHYGTMFPELDKYGEYLKKKHGY